jgi:hypothetical protein
MSLTPGAGPGRPWPPARPPCATGSRRWRNFGRLSDVSDFGDRRNRDRREPDEDLRRWFKKLFKYPLLWRHYIAHNATQHREPLLKGKAQYG